MEIKECLPQVLDLFPEALFIVSFERILYANPAFMKLIAFKEEDKNKKYPDLIAEYVIPEDRPLLTECIESYKKRNTGPHSFELRMQHGGRALQHIDVQVHPFSSRENVYLIILRDITIRKTAEKALVESELIYRSLVERANEGIGIVEDGIIRYVNPFLEKICGFPAEEMIGKAFHSFISTDNLPSIEALVDRHKQGLETEKNFEAKIRHKFSHYVHVDLNVNKILYHGKTAHLIVGHDITRHKNTQDELSAALGKLRHTMRGIIQTITKIVESRDIYTAGHQRRVSDFARSIAAKMNLSQDIVDAIRIAGSVHDLGKISVPAEILSKPSKLTHYEMEMIKTHPKAGYDILATIDFPWPIAEIVYQHHERLDGSGYPRGLTGKDIRIEAGIIAVADIVEAMISHRPYRPARPLAEVLVELKRNRKVKYDEKVVDACLDLLIEDGYAFPKSDDRFMKPFGDAHKESPFEIAE